MQHFIENRKVTKTIKNQNGDIVALCNDSELWSPKLKSIAIPEIELNINRYYIVYNNKEIDIQVVKDYSGEKILVSNSSDCESNILFSLPDSF